MSTTLVVSPSQLVDACVEILRAIAPRHGLIPVWRDFRPLYPEATRESRELGMYRQNYCGCRFSAAEAAIERHEARDARKRAKACKGDSHFCTQDRGPRENQAPRRRPCV